MGKRLMRVGFYVEVEVEAWPQEAHILAEAACGWPGDWRPPHDPVEVEGPFDGGRVTVKARILRSQALMVKPVAPSGSPATDQGPTDG